MHLSRRSVGRNSDYYSSVPRVRSYSYFIPSDEDYDTQAQELINIYKHYARAPVVYSHHTVSTTPNFSRFHSEGPTRAMVIRIKNHRNRPLSQKEVEQILLDFVVIAWLLLQPTNPTNAFSTLTFFQYFNFFLIKIKFFFSITGTKHCYNSQEDYFH